MFIDKIERKPNKKAGDILKLKASEQPLVMYGAGSYAQEVLKFLERQNITVDKIYIDEKYLSNDKLELKGIEIVGSQLIKEIYDSFNVVIAFADYKTAVSSVQEIKNARNIFFLDAIHDVDFFDYNYIIDNISGFNETYRMLADVKSKEIFVAFLNAVINGNNKYLYDYFDNQIYFNELINVTEEEVFVDCGAYDGDTIREFVKFTQGRYKRIYAFEPDEENFKKLAEYKERANIRNMNTINKGCWDKNEIISFTLGEDMQSAVNESGEGRITATSLDFAINGPVTFIKMDIEGAELKALEGASRIIRKNRPKLAISVYHKPDDLIAIPTLIKKLNPNYKIYLRQHRYGPWDTVLYAI